jgi:hypothetical protein
VAGVDGVRDGRRGAAPARQRSMLVGAVRHGRSGMPSDPSVSGAQRRAFTAPLASLVTRSNTAFRRTVGCSGERHAVELYQGRISSASLPPDSIVAGRHRQPPFWRNASREQYRRCADSTGSGVGEVDG